MDLITLLLTDTVRIPVLMFLTMNIVIGLGIIFLALILRYPPARFFARRAIWGAGRPVGLFFSPSKYVVLKEGRIDLDEFQAKFGKQRWSYQFRPEAVYNFYGAKAIPFYTTIRPAILVEDLAIKEIKGGKDGNPIEFKGTVQLDPKKWEDEVAKYNDMRAWYTILENKVIAHERLNERQLTRIIVYAIAGAIVIISIVVAAFALPSALKMFLG